jgi:YVTN family beta-propeller protein
MVSTGAPEIGVNSPKPIISSAIRVFAPTVSPFCRWEDAMKLRLFDLLAIACFAVSSLLGSAQSFAQNAYITNQGDNTVSVIATANNTVTTTIKDPRFNRLVGVAASPDQNRVYVANNGASMLLVISTATNSVIFSIPVGNGPVGVAVSPDGQTVYVANEGDSPGTVSVITTANNIVTPIRVGTGPYGVAVSADGSKVYVTNAFSNNVSVISAATNTLLGSPIAVGSDPRGVVVTPDGSKVYVANFGSNNVSVIDTTTGVATPINDSSFNAPLGVAVTPDGSKVYVTNFFGNTVSVIATATDTVTPVVSSSSCAGAIPVGSFPFGVSISPDGSTVYVANEGDGTKAGTVSVIATATNAVTTQVTVGFEPVALGVFISPEVVPVPASGTTCNGVYSGTFTGNIVVSAGQNCTFIDGGTVNGNVTVKPGGNFSSSGTKIQGTLTISGGTWSQVKNTQVAGDMQILDSPAAPTTAAPTISPTVATNSSSTATPVSPTSFLCGTTVLGDLTFDSNGTAAQIGAANPIVCAGNTITGQFEANNNTGTVLIFDNVVGRDMQVFKNTGLLDVVGNNIGGNLHCQNNSVLVMGGMNTAKNTQGECGP